MALPDSLGVVLQWGHGISAVEICLSRCSLITCRWASMGPRHFCRGNRRACRDRRRRSVGFNGATAFLPWKLRCDDAPTADQTIASMGPRHFCRGNLIRHRVVDADEIASMGPRHFCRGNGMRPLPSRRRRRRFNGATAFLPWKYRARRALAFRRAHSFNGATAFLPWK